MSDSLYNFAQQLKTEIVRMADGKDGDVMNIVNKEDLEAANQVMLAPARKGQTALRCHKQLPHAHSVHGDRSAPAEHH